MNAADSTRKDYRERFADLEVPLRQAQVWASLLEKVVQSMERWPNMSEIEQAVAREELDFVAEPLKNVIDNMDTIYHQRSKEEVRA